jgi:hypothetical protein
MDDLERARTVPCPGCKMPAGSACVDLETGAEATGVHQVRIYRAYVVAEADAHNRAAALEAEVERLRSSAEPSVIASALKRHYAECTRTHPGNDAWHECEGRAVSAAITSAGSTVQEGQTP